MSSEFNIIRRARGREGTSSLFVGILPCAVAFGFLAMVLVYEVHVKWFVYALLVGLAILGLVLLLKAIKDIAVAKEWEFRCSETRVLWLIRDHLGERIQCEIYIRDIAELLY